MTIKVNGQKIRYSTFPAGEEHVNIVCEEMDLFTEITADLRSSKDVMQLLLTVDAVRRIRYDTNIKLTIPYFPYARQDRVCRVGEAFSLRVMAELINSLKCWTVRIIDPHSNLCQELVHRCTTVTQSQIILNSNLKYKLIDEHVTLVAPDVGATSKTSLLAGLLNLVDMNCTKTRDTKTGTIKEVSCPSIYLEYNNNRNYMIIDDICDGGRTFIELAKQFKKAGVSNLSLYVTHGIFSNGLKELSTYFKEIYCYHTWLNTDEIRKYKLKILGEMK